VALEKTRDAFQVGRKAVGFPTKGTTLLCLPTKPWSPQCQRRLSLGLPPLHLPLRRSVQWGLYHRHLHPQIYPAFHHLLSQ